MLHVVHEIDRQRVLRARIERREHPRHAVGRNDLGLLEAGVEHQLPHIFGAFLVVDVHVGDGRKLDPVAQTLDRCVMIRLDRDNDLLAPRIAGLRHGH